LSPHDKLSQMKHLIISLFLCIPILVSAQAKSKKQWQDLQKKFQYYHSTVEDYDKAEGYLKKMQRISAKKFKYTDSLYALTITREAELFQARKYFAQSNKVLETHLARIREEHKKGKKLSFSHYNLLLVYGNNSYYIAESLMFGRNLTDNILTVPSLPEERFKMALLHFNKAIDVFLELKQLYPIHPFVDENTGSVYRIKGRLQGQYLGDLTECVSSLEKSLEYGDDLETYRLLGVANGILGKHFVAISYFEKGLNFTAGPDAAALLYGLEVAYRQLSDRENDPIKKKDFSSKADSYQIQRKAADPNFDPLGGN
jgi:hypothetical protein